MNQDIQTSHAVVAEGLSKRYGEQWALRDFRLAVPTGSVLGLLGHNGAGKTTAIRILTTLASPTEGTAKVVGHDVVAEPDRVREQIGLTSQAATVDGLMSGAANLEMIGRLYHLPRKVARARATELLAELRSIYLEAGPNLEFTNMAPRPFDLGPVSDVAGETWRTFAKWPILRTLTVWCLFALLLGTAFYLTRL